MPRVVAEITVQFAGDIAGPGRLVGDQPGHRLAQSGIARPVGEQTKLAIGQRQYCPISIEHGLATVTGQT